MSTGTYTGIDTDSVNAAGPSSSIREGQSYTNSSFVNTQTPTTSSAAFGGNYRHQGGSFKKSVNNGGNMAPQ